MANAIKSAPKPNYAKQSGTPGCDNSYGKTTAEIKQQFTFEGWDFIKVWDIGEGQTYPYLRTHLAGDVNKDGIVNFLDLCILAGQWMEGEPPEQGVEIANVRIIRGELDGGVFQAIEEVEDVEVGDGVCEGTFEFEIVP